MGVYYKAIVEMFNRDVVQARVRVPANDQFGEVCIGFPDGHICILRVVPGGAEDVAANLREWLRAHLADNGIAFAHDDSVK